jgi:hypothetical protein
LLPSSTIPPPPPNYLLPTPYGLTKQPLQAMDGSSLIYINRYVARERRVRAYLIIMHYRPPLPTALTNAHTQTDIQYSRVTGCNNPSPNPQIVPFIPEKKNAHAPTRTRSKAYSAGFWRQKKKINERRKERRKKVKCSANDDQTLLNVGLFIPRDRE